MEYELECEDCKHKWLEQEIFLNVAVCPACGSDHIIDVFDASV
jgi:Zn finger protein HypA/HybF involved in hydrogenase expression